MSSTFFSPSALQPCQSRLPPLLAWPSRHLLPLLPAATIAPAGDSPAARMLSVIILPTKESSHSFQGQGCYHLVRSVPPKPPAFPPATASLIPLLFSRHTVPGTLWSLDLTRLQLLYDSALWIEIASSERPPKTTWDEPPCLCPSQPWTRSLPLALGIQRPGFRVTLALHLPARLEVGFLQHAHGCVLGSQGTENLHIGAHHLLTGFTHLQPVRLSFKRIEKCTRPRLTEKGTRQQRECNSDGVHALPR